jgi:hypothetical protein
MPCSKKSLGIAVIHVAAMLQFYSLQKYYTTNITYFSEAYNHASFEDLNVSGTSLILASQACACPMLLLLAIEN